MYAQTTIAGLMVPLINPQQYQQNFNFSANTPDQELNQFTPQVAMAAAHLMTSAVANQHPLRVNALNVMGQNGFVNNEFRTFITHVMRISLAMFEQQQINSVNQIISGKLPELVQLVSATLALHNPAVVQMLDQGTNMQAQQMSQAWFNLVQHSENVIARAAQVRQQQGMGMGGAQQMSPAGYAQPAGFGMQPQQPQQQLNSFGTNFGSSTTTGAFVTSHHQQPAQSAATLPHTPVGGGSRFQRKLMAEQQTQQAAQSLTGYDHERGVSVMNTPQPMQVQQPVQQAAPAASTKQSVGAGLSYAERLKAELGQVSVGTMPASATQTIIERQAQAVQTMQQPSAMQSFQQQVTSMGQEPVYIDPPAHTSTVYERGEMDASATTAAPVAVVDNKVQDVISKIEPKPVLKEFTLNGHLFRMVSMLFTTKVGEQEVPLDYKTSGWKPSRFQTHFPAWCRRTHEIAYCYNDEGIVVAITLPLSEDKVNEMFKYEAHAIDQTKGLPSKPIEVPVREEAKVLYTQELEPEVKVNEREEILNATSDSDLMEQVLSDATLAFAEDKETQYHISSGQVMSTINAHTPEMAQRLYDQVREVYLQVSFASAAKMIKKIELPSLRRRVNGLYKDALNEVLAIQLGLDAAIDNFIKEAPTIIEDVDKEFGESYSDTLAALQADFVCSVCDAYMPVEAEAHHQSMIDVEAEDADAVSASMFYLSHKAKIMVTRFTGDELAIGLAPYGASQLAQDSYPNLYAAMSKYFNVMSGKKVKARTILLSTIDGVTYKVCQSPLNPAMFLIMAA